MRCFLWITIFFSSIFVLIVCFAQLRNIIDLPSSEENVTHDLTSVVQTDETKTTTTTTTTTTLATIVKNDNDQRNRDPPYICLKNVWGAARACNRILQIANVLQKAHDNHTKLALSREWTLFYEEWFDPRPDIILNYTGSARKDDQQCLSVHAGRDAHYLHNPSLQGPNPALVTLVPKVQYRQAAEEAVEELLQEANNQTGTGTSLSLPSSWVSVHRRSLEKQCHMRVTVWNKTWCTTSDVVTTNFCDIMYDDVVNMTKKEEELQHQQHQQAQNWLTTIWNKNVGSISNNKNKTIVLFTDNQDKKRDNTFPIQDKHSFHVQLWMMTLSSIHYGNTASSVDYIIHHWRHGKQMRPAECWPEF